MVTLHLPGLVPDAVGTRAAGDHPGRVNGQETASGISRDAGEAHDRAERHGDITSRVQGADFLREESAELRDFDIAAVNDELLLLDEVNAKDDLMAGQATEDLHGPHNGAS